MTAKAELASFKRKLESVIKNAFEKIIQIDGEFEVAADYKTHLLIDEIFEKLGLAVYGMAITPSEFTITFEFTGPYLTINCSHMPMYCHIKLQNDGEYTIMMTEDILKDDWNLEITDHFFNAKALSEEAMLAALKDLNHILMLTVLSN